MTRFIIFVKVEGKTRENLIQHRRTRTFGTTETFSVHPILPDTPYFISYDIGALAFESDRPMLRSKGLSRRPAYTLVQGTIDHKPYLKELIDAIDAWVMKNLD